MFLPLVLHSLQMGAPGSLQARSLTCHKGKLPAEPACRYADPSPLDHHDWDALMLLIVTTLSAVCLPRVAYSVEATVQFQVWHAYIAGGSLRTSGRS